MVVSRLIKMKVICWMRRETIQISSGIVTLDLRQRVSPPPVVSAAVAVSADAAPPSAQPSRQWNRVRSC